MPCSPSGLVACGVLLSLTCPATAALQPYALTMNQGQKARIDLLATATGDFVPATLAIDQIPVSGSAAIQADNTILYTHTTGTPASDSFVAKVADSGGQFSYATVSITFDSDLRFANPHLNVPAAPPATTYAIENAFGSLTFTDPVCLASPPGDIQRLFVCQKGGLLRVIPDVTATTPTASTFLNLSGIRSVNATLENGLLGLAFHPNYATNRYFYVFYSVNDGGLHQRVSRFTTQAGNPNLADTASELILINQLDQADNHNGGDLHFGPDGYLYISVGDEGSSNDNPTFNSQLINKDLFSGILRIDVDRKPANVAPTAHASIPTDSGVARFSIPFDNPFVLPAQGGPWDGTYNGSTVTGTVRREFYATGLRNPWRMSFDPLTGQLWCGDVGQNAREEIDIIVKGGNYGWVFREALLTGPRTTNPTMPANFDALYHVEPVYNYNRDNDNFGGTSVTGGLVYRGTRIAALYGKYIFADYNSGNIWCMDTDTYQVDRIAGEGGITAFGTDPSNQDILLADYNNDRIRRLVASTPTNTFPATLSATGLFADLSDLSPSPGLIPYEANLPFWSDHAIKRRWFIVPDGSSQFTWSQDNPWTSPNGTIWVKHFDLELERGNPATKKRLETRLLVKNAGGSYGVSYRWNEAQTEATLVADEGDDFVLNIDHGGSMIPQTWHIPSRAECLICHTPQAGHALSFNTRQLNRAADLLGFTGNQLSTLHTHGFLSGNPGSPNFLPRHLAPHESDYSLEARVRSYLAVNCAYCHRDGGTAGASTWDGRPELTLDDTGLLLGVAASNGGDSANKLVVPGDTAHSIILSRVAVTNNFTRMPPIASNELDQGAITLLTDWIANKLPARQTYAQWRLARFGSDSSPQGEPGIDADLDGFTNEDEFLHGTLPLNPGSLPALAISSAASTTLLFTLPENRSFRVMSSTDLSGWTLWDVSGNNGLPFPGGLLEFVGPLDGPERYFSLDISEN